MNKARALRWLGFSLQCGLGIFLMWWIVASSQVDVGQLAQRLEIASFVPLTAAALCFVTAMGMGALRFHLFLPSTIPVSYLMGTTLLQNALLTFIPWRLGELSYPIQVRRDYGIPLGSSGAVILAIRLVDFGLLAGIAVAGSARLGLDMRAAGLALGAACFAAMLAAVVLRMRRTVTAALVQTIRSAVRPLLSPARLARFLLFSIAIFTLATLQSTLALRALGLGISFIDVALLNAITMLAALLPIHPPGGWGTIDSIQIAVLLALGYSSHIAVPAILAAHTFYTLIILMGGVTGWLLSKEVRPARETGV